MNTLNINILKIMSDTMWFAYVLEKQMLQPWNVFTCMWRSSFKMRLSCSLSVLLFSVTSLCCVWLRAVQGYHLASLCLFPQSRTQSVIMIWTLNIIIFIILFMTSDRSHKHSPVLCNFQPFFNKSVSRDSVHIWRKAKISPWRC